MNIDKLRKLPPEVQDIVFDDNNPQLNAEIAEQFNLSPEDFKKILNILIDVIVKNIKVTDFPVELAKLNIKDIDTSQVALAFALKRLWPLQDYLGNVDLLIRRLGGDVPKQKIDIKPRSGDDDTHVTADVKSFLDESTKRKYYWLTKPQIEDPDGNIVDPTIENWLKDYLHFAGYTGSDSLSRSKFLVESNNIRKLDEADKMNVLNFLTSYGEKEEMRISVEDNFITIEPLADKITEVAQSPESSSVQLDEIIQKYKSAVTKIQSDIDKQVAAFKMDKETPAKLMDILWNSIGLGEKERVVASLATLARKNLLAESLKQDKRFVGILRRYINVRFGSQAKEKWQPTNITSTYWVIFFGLIFQEKLNLTTEEAAIHALYISQVMGLQKKPVYIDVASNAFRFRDVSFTSGQFKIVDV